MSRRGLRRVVVVVHGIAGLTAADALREAGHDGEVVLVGEEHHPAYSRPALSKGLLRTPDDLTAHRLPSTDHGADERLGTRAVGVDLERHLVRLEDGEEVPWDGLVVTTGCRPRRLGGPDSRELSLRTLDDALALRERFAARPRLVVVGGGPLGMEVASAALTAGCEVDLVSPDVPMLPHLGPELAELFVTAARERGLGLHRGNASLMPGTAEAPTVRLRSGERLEADLVVTAIGDIPNTEWLKGTGLVRNGVVPVDSRGRVRPDVVAAGDIAAVPIGGRLCRRPLWNSAIDQARAAATALVRGDDAPELIHRPYFWTEQFGLSLKAVGHLPGRGEPTWLATGTDDASSALLRWGGTDGPAAAVNLRMPIPRLRRIAAGAA